MGLFGRKKKKRAKKPVLEPVAASVAPVAAAAPVARLRNVRIWASFVGVVQMVVYALFG